MIVEPKPAPNRMYLSMQDKLMQKHCHHKHYSMQERAGERGTAMLIAVLIMALLSVFVAAAISRVTTDATIVGNDAAEQRDFYAAQASLETMTRNFNKIYDLKLTPTASDIAAVQAAIPPGFTNYDFSKQTVTQTSASASVVLTGGPFVGLNSLQDRWTMQTTVTNLTLGTSEQLTRTFLNNRIPIFQFGMFYNHDLEIAPGATFNFGGRVHTNANLYMRGGGTVQFSSKVTAAGEIVVDVARNGTANIASPTAQQAAAGFGQNLYIKDNNGVFQQLKIGTSSVTNGPSVPGDTSPSVEPPNAPASPTGSFNSLWQSSYSDHRGDVKLINDIFTGNLIARTTPLQLPIKLGGATDNIEIIKRGQQPGDYANATMGIAADNQVVTVSRYSNHPGIRVTLTDSQNELPLDSSGNHGGVRLDGASNGAGGNMDADNTRGYQPDTMLDGYKAQRINGSRLYTGQSYTDNGPGQPANTMPANRQTWIKVELVTTNPSTLLPVTTDITKDILSLGMTHLEPASNGGFGIGDSRAIIKIQRYEVLGPPIKVSIDGSNRLTQAVTTVGGQPAYEYNDTYGQMPLGYGNLAKGRSYVNGKSDYLLPNEASHEYVINGSLKPVPIPIEMFDGREGLDNEFYGSNSPYYNTGRVPYAGVMSMIDIDVANIRQLLSGAFDGKFPHGLTSTSWPNSNGWSLYVSDRRGDRNFDGCYTMEDVYGPNDGILQPGEDVNAYDYNDTHGINLPDTDYDWEAPAYREGAGPTYSGGGNTWGKADGTAGNDPPAILQPGTITHFASANSDLAATMDHKYYRRGVRLINATQLPGDEHNGFTLASENGVYIFGNYNATSVSTHGSPTADTSYLPGPVVYSGSGNPIASNSEVPASVVGDAVTILSGNWTDGMSFAAPDDSGRRPPSETTVRAAILAGDTMSALTSTPNQGGLMSQNNNGGVVNFKRFLENWGGTTYMNFCGSLIGLFNSQNNSGPFKYGSGEVYSAPIRNWTFDTSFLDPTRLPPGTPFFQYVQITGFQRTNN